MTTIPYGPRYALADLGDTADDVAANLRTFSITGTRSQREHPLANYLVQRGFPRVAITRLNVYSWSEDSRETIEPLPLGARRFVTEFGCGAYPDLDSGGGRTFGRSMREVP